MDDDDETWLTGPVITTSPAAAAAVTATTTSASKGTSSSDLDSWLSNTASAIDFSTRSALSRKLKGYAEKKARRRQLRSASTVSLESVTEESPKRTGEDEEDNLTVEDSRSELTLTPVPLCTSSPFDKNTVDGSFDYRLMDADLDASIDGREEEDEEYKKLEEAALGLSLQSEGGGEVDEEEERGEKEEERAVETTQDDDDEFYDAPSEFEDEEKDNDDDGSTHSNGRSRELESLVEEPARNARQQMMGARLGVTPRSSSVSPRLAAQTIQPSPPKAAAHRMERVQHEIVATPVRTMKDGGGAGGGGGTMTMMRRGVGGEMKQQGGMSVSLHMPTGHSLPPRRVLPPGRENGGVKNGGGGGEKRGGEVMEKKVNLHEDLAKIQQMAREQEEALRREVMGSLSANDVSNGENDSRLITNSKSVEFVGKREFQSRLPTPSRRVLPVRTTRTATAPLRPSPNAVGGGCSTSGGSSSISESGSINRESGRNGNDDIIPNEDECF